MARHYSVTTTTTLVHRFIGFFPGQPG